MYLVRSLRTFIGTNAERVAAGLGAFLAGDEFIETDTSNKYIHDGIAWRLDSVITDPGGSDGRIQYNNGGVFGGAIDLIYDDASGYFGVGTSPDSRFHVHESGGAEVQINYSSLVDSNFFTFARQSFFALNDAAEEIEYVKIQMNVESNADGNEAASFGIYRRVGGVLAAVFLMSNTNSEIAGTLYVGDDLFVASGNIAKFESTGTVFNESGADRDFRIEGDTLTHLFFIDASADTVGINTSNPSSSYKLHVVSTAANSLFERSATGAAGINVFYNPDSTDGNAAVISFATDTTGSGATAQKAGVQLWGITNTHNDATYATEFQIRTRVAGVIGSRFSVTGNVNIDGTTTALVLSRLTTTQQNALTGVNGMIIYNTSTNKFRGYAGGAWVDLH